jgi:RNA polymerase sigma-70 factor (ECF subfamily)
MTASHDGAERIYLELVAELQQPILNYLYRMVGDRDLAEDLTQETYLRAYRALERIDLTEEAAPRRKAWLYRIAHNAATDHLRRRARLRWLPLDIAGLSRPSPEREIIAADPVGRSLDLLEPAHREVLLLFSQEGLSTQEVAEVLGITEAAARKRRQRARQAFMRLYQEHDDDL